MPAIKRKWCATKATIDSDSEEERDVDIGISVDAGGLARTIRQLHSSPTKHTRVTATHIPPVFTTFESPPAPPPSTQPEKPKRKQVGKENREPFVFGLLIYYYRAHLL